MGKKKLSYKEATAEINHILQTIEQENPDMDQLAQLVKQGLTLISSCQEKLRDTEASIISGFDNLEQNKG